jgi:hypothetical protein
MAGLLCDFATRPGYRSLVKREFDTIKALHEEYLAALRKTYVLPKVPDPEIRPNPSLLASSMLRPLDGVEALSIRAVTLRRAIERRSFVLRRRRRSSLRR